MEPASDSAAWFWLPASLPTTGRRARLHLAEGHSRPTDGDRYLAMTVEM